MTASGIPVSLSYQIITTTELTEEFNTSIDVLSLRDEDGDWQPVPGGDSEEDNRVTEVKIDGADRIELRMANTSIGSRRLETAATLPPNDIEIPTDLELKPYGEVEISVDILVGDNLQTSNEETYLYNPHLVVEISGKRINKEQSELLLRTEIHQNQEGVVMYGPPTDITMQDKTATGTEMIQVE